MSNPPAIRIGGGPGGGRGGGGSYQIALQDPDTEELYRVAPEFEAALREMPGLQDVNSDLQLRTPQLTVDLDREQIAQLGLTVEQVQSALSYAYASRQISQIFAPDDEYQVMMQVAPEFQQNPAALSMLYVQGSGGTPHPAVRRRHDAADRRPAVDQSHRAAAVGDDVVQPRSLASRSATRSRAFRKWRARRCPTRSPRHRRARRRRSRNRSAAWAGSWCWRSS